MAQNGPQVVAVGSTMAHNLLLWAGLPPSETLGKCGIGNFVTNGWPNYLVRSELCPYIWAMNELQTLSELGYTVSLMDAHCNSVNDLSVAATWSVLGPGGFTSGKVPKRKPFVDYVLNTIAKKEARQYQSLMPLFARLDLRHVSCYPTTYGIGICTLFRSRAGVDEDVAKVADALSSLGIEYRNEYSNEHWVYRFIISTKSENLSRIPQ